MADNKEIVDLVITAENLATKELEKAAKDVKGLGKEVAITEAELDQLKIDKDTISSYTQLKSEVGKLTAALAVSSVEYDKSKAALKENKIATDKDRESLKKQKILLKAQTSELAKRNTQLLKSKAALKSLGASTKKAGESEKIYAARIIHTQEKLTKLTAIQEKRVNSLRSSISAQQQEVVSMTKATFAQEKAAIAKEKAAIADIKTKSAQAQSIKQADKYIKAIEHLNAELKKGAITKTQFIAKEKLLRSSFNQTAGAANKATAAIDLNDKVSKKAAISTDSLTKVTRRLAQAYTVLIAAQSAGRAISANVEEFGALEAAQTKVLKTTDLMKSEIVSMTDELIKMATEVTPTATNELLRYAEVAGQLGVEGTANILRMVGAADALNVSTDLAGDEAATLLTRILTMTKEGIPAIDGLASAVVELGNNTATTESKIVQMTKEIVTGTQSIGLSSAAAAAFGATLKEIGQRGESSRTAFSRLSNTIKLAVSEGGDELGNLSRITGQTADDLEKNLGERPEKILLDFVVGLQRIKEEGGSVARTLDQFGVKGTDALAVIEALANNNERLARNLLLASNAQKDGTAHLREAAEAYSTQDAALGRLNNKFIKIKASIGEAFSDETNSTINALGDTLLDNEELIISFFESLVGLGEELTDIGEAALDAGGSLSGLTVGNALLTSSMTTLHTATLGLKNGFIFLSITLKQVEKDYLSFRLLFDKNNEGLMKSWEKLDKEQDALLTSMAENNSKYYKNLLITNGQSSHSYEDLLSAVKKYGKEVGQLDEKQKAQLDAIIKSGVHNKELEDTYRGLVSSIVKLSRKNDIVAKGRERLAELDKEELERKKLIVKADGLHGKSQKLVADQIKLTEERLVVLNTAFEAGGISALSYHKTQESLLATKKGLQSAVTGLLHELPKEIEAVKSLDDGYSKLSDTTLTLTKARDKALRALGKANDASKKATGLEQASEKATKAVAVAKRDLDDATKELNTQLDLEKNSVSQLFELRKSLTKEIEAAQKAKDKETGSVVAHNKKLDELKKKLAAVNKLLGDSKKGTDGLTASTKDNTVATEDNRLTLEQMIETRKADIVVQREQFNASIEAGKAASAAVSISSKLITGNSLASASADELTASYVKLSNTFVGVKATIGNLSDTGRKIDGILRRNRESTLAFIRQRLEVLRLNESLGDTNLTMEQLAHITSRVGSGFSELDDSQIAPLRAAIESARAEFERLDASIDASLSRTQDRLDRLLGNERDILDRRFERELAEAQEQLKQARANGDRGSVANAQENIAALRKIHKIELDNFKEKERAKVKAELDAADTKAKAEADASKAKAKAKVDTATQRAEEARQETNSSQSAVAAATRTVDVRISLPNGTTSTIQVADNGSADDLIDVLSSLGENNIRG